MNRELLRVENLSVAYGDTQVVKGIDFSLRAGETLALVFVGSASAWCSRSR